MTEVALFEAKNRLSELIDRVLAGEEIAITRRGKVVARLAPSDDEEADRVRGLDAVARLKAAREGVRLSGLSSRADRPQIHASGQALIDALQASPHRDIEIEPARSAPMPVRAVEL